MKLISLLAAMLMILASCTTAPNSENERQMLVQQSTDSLKQMQAEDSSLHSFLEHSYGYAIFPSVGKGGFIAGGAYGRGILYEKGRMIGYSDLSQATVGLQAGGQSYSELVVFEQQRDFDRFIGGRFTFSANASAVAIKTGAASAAQYTDGVAVFVEPIGGLMVEAAIGGQQFTYIPR
ncbi:MAG TPA: lipid-binding SYLF domain-containing protein [Tepidisphaeraceae bacterium]|nr:lipid-binding SYLF domain-containing protein [Tepidisphaeraceae bacterium]